jgi:hypothetical protein
MQSPLPAQPENVPLPEQRPAAPPPAPRPAQPTSDTRIYEEDDIEIPTFLRKRR